MVLLSTKYSRNAHGRKGLVESDLFLRIVNLTIANLLSLCKECLHNAMASIPPSAFSARKIREAAQREMKVSKVKSGNETTQFFHTKLVELTPLKYNSKLMNSIWGFYNRYSPHNVKKVNDALIPSGELQQSAASSSTKGEPMITLPSAKLDNMWPTINVSQSH